jgi:hypothetical protein
MNNATTENGLKKGNNKVAFRTLKTLTQPKQSRIKLIEDKDRQLLTEKEPIMTRWAEYCRELYNYNLEPDHQLLNGTSHEGREESKAEILRELVIS